MEQSRNKIRLFGCGVNPEVVEGQMVNFSRTVNERDWRRYDRQRARFSSINCSQNGTTLRYRKPIEKRILFRDHS